jgi:UDP-N-acetyl-D-glucosamine dehydrogenase
MAYKPDIADLRESPSLEIFEILHQEGAQVAFHDPLITSLRIGDHTFSGEVDLNAATSDSDVVVLLQAHSAYDINDLVDRSNFFFDTRGVTRGEKVERL